MPTIPQRETRLKKPRSDFKRWDLIGAISLHFVENGGKVGGSNFLKYVFESAVHPLSEIQFIEVDWTLQSGLRQDIIKRQPEVDNNTNGQNMWMPTITNLSTLDSSLVQLMMSNLAGERVDVGVEDGSEKTRLFP
ncbi:hypothetical protein Fcan01_08698 [Folsomia candida]|uniref:Uncharacterized protein n=1 Tax=Folsomia candida TaxID=158441 RepID=A0A226EHI4_FOLCA|nr:hypothetical protein Fcan01_08698 [Folsomia candida]